MTFVEEKQKLSCPAFPAGVSPVVALGHWGTLGYISLPPFPASHGYPKVFVLGYRNPRKEFGWNFAGLGEPVEQWKQLF